MNVRGWMIVRIDHHVETILSEDGGHFKLRITELFLMLQATGDTQDNTAYHAGLSG